MVILPGTRLMAITLTRAVPSLLICISFWFVLAEPVSALSIREILGLENGDTAVESDSSAKEKKDTIAENSKKAKKTQQDKTKKGIETRLDFAEIKKILAVLDEKQRKALLADEQAFQKFIRQEAVNKSVLSAAKANKSNEYCGMEEATVCLFPIEK